MADVEFGTEFPELNLLTLEEATIDGEAVECVVVDENVISSMFQGQANCTAPSQLRNRTSG